jgi:hypothetical protein
MKQRHLDGTPFTDEEQFEWDYQNQARWAIYPVSREQFRADQARIAEKAANGTLGPNPYEW